MVEDGRRNNGGPRPKVRADDRRPSKGQFGQPAFVVREGEREKVKELGRVCTARQIGLILRGPDEPISCDTILKYFPDELNWARANMIATASGKLIDAVLAGKESSIHFTLRTMGDPGQFVERREHSGPGGGPIPVADLAALAGLPDDTLKKVEQIATLVAGLVGESADGTAAVPDPAGPA